VAKIVEDNAAPRRILDPSHPLADENGYVTMSNVNVVEEMVNYDLRLAQLPKHIDVMNTAKKPAAENAAAGHLIRSH